MDPAIQQLFQQQLRLMELFTERLRAPQLTPSLTKLIMPEEALENSVTEFHYNTDVNSTFSTCFMAYQTLWVIYYEIPFIYIYIYVCVCVCVWLYFMAYQPLLVI